jgi:hypothetical protein
LSKHPQTHIRQRAFSESIITAVSVGTALILIGAIYVTALPTSLWDKTVAFFSSFEILEVPSTAIHLPVPADPAAHAVLYNAAFQLCIGIAVLQIILIALRLMFHSSTSKTAETAGNLVYWFGASYLVGTFLNSSTTVTTWFAFWAAILVVIGISLIARAVVIFAKNHLQPRSKQ